MVDILFVDLAGLVVYTRSKFFHVTHVDLYPFLFGQSLVLLHENGLRHDGFVEWRV